jgi:hypothetical protein
VVGQLLELGLESAGASMVGALLRFTSMNASAGADPASVAFAIKFLAHAFWLHHLYGPPDELSPVSDMAALLVAAAEVEPALVWPLDVPAAAALFTSFRARLDALAPQVRARNPERYQVLLSLCRFAAGRG